MVTMVACVVTKGVGCWGI